MKNPTQKSIKRLSIATLMIGGLTLAYTYWEMIAQLWVDSYIYPLAWNPDIKGWQIFILAARFVGITSLFILCCIFLYHCSESFTVVHDIHQQAVGEFPFGNLARIDTVGLGGIHRRHLQRIPRRERFGPAADLRE